MFRFTAKSLSIVLAAALVVMVGAHSAFGGNPVAGTNLDFFIAANWSDNTVPNLNSAGPRFGSGLTGVNSMIYDPATQSPGNMTYVIGTNANTADYYLGVVPVPGSYTLTHESGDLTWGYRSDVDWRKFEMSAVTDATYVMNGGTARFGSRGLRLQSTADGNSLFDHNAGDVIVESWGTAELGLLIGIAGAGTATYQIGGGTLETPMLAIDTDGVLNFDPGSTGVMYVNTSDKSAADIAALITAGDIVDLGGEGFVVAELTTGDYAGFTEVKLVPEPASLALLFLGLPFVMRRKRR